MSKSYSGATHEAEIPFIPAESWQKGKTFSGVVEEIDDSNPDFGLAYVVAPDGGPVEVGGQKYSLVRIGGLTGLEFAIKAAKAKGMPEIVPGVTLCIECIGVKKSRSKDMSDRPNFQFNAVFPDF
jgi:hypothetical protein